jgi:hypothetical protein
MARKNAFLRRRCRAEILFHADDDGGDSDDSDDCHMEAA